MSASQSVYEQVGGESFFNRLTEAFYDGVSEDEILRPMYPPGDLSEAREKLKLFLMQYWGGPDDYSQQRGHPRLRMRHMPFAIDEVARDAWVANMKRALDSTEVKPELREQIWGYFEMAATAMINTHSE